MLSGLSKMGYSTWNKDYALIFTIIDSGLKAKEKEDKTKIVDSLAKLCEKNPVFLEHVHRILYGMIEKEQIKINETLNEIKYIDPKVAPEKVENHVKRLSHLSFEELAEPDSEDGELDEDAKAAAIEIKKFEENIKSITEFGEAVLKKVGALQLEKVTQEQSPLFSSQRR